MLVLDLFAGSKSVERTLSKNKYNVISLDNVDKYKPDIVVDILKWKYKEVDYVPDFIWASPPCNTFTYLNPRHGREAISGKAVEPQAKLGDRLLFRTFQIIRHFHKKNPYLLFVIENPRAMMRKNNTLKKIDRRTVLYCNYGDNVRKPTDLFTNATFLKLNEYNKCPDGKKIIGVVQRCSSFERSKVPKKLIKSIFTQFERNYKKSKSHTIP